MFKITVAEIPVPKSVAQLRLGEETSLPLGQSIERYSQTVDNLDMGGLIAVINKVPRKPRKTTKQD